MRVIRGIRLQTIIVRYTVFSVYKYMFGRLKLLIVIVNYKAANLVINCLESIAMQIDSRDFTWETQVAVCENGTGENEVKLIEDAINNNQWEDWCWLKPIMPNRGFAGGNNIILEEALHWEHPPECFLLLNADTVMRPDSLRQLLETADSHPKAGIISPRLEWPDGDPQISCFRFFNPLSELIDAAHTGLITRLLKKYDVPIELVDIPTEPPWTTFACALIRTEVFKQVGLLDPGYFLYFDDPDFCRRARKCGWKVLNWPDARVVHLRGKSNPVKSLTLELKRRPAYFYKSRARYFAKFYTPVGLWVANLLWLLGRFVSWLRETIGKKPPHICQDQGKDIWKNWLTPLKHNDETGVDIL